MAEKEKTTQRLQLFNAIKEIKREGYVGTYDALMYARILNDIDRIPKIVVDKINKSIIDSGIELSFRATEENVFGLVRGIKILNTELLRALKEKHENNEDIFIYLKIKKERLDKGCIYNYILDFDLNDYYNEKYGVYPSYELLSIAASKLFKKMQGKVLTSKDLGVKAAWEVFESCYLLTTDEKLSINKLINEFDWTESMSKANFYDIKNFMKKTARSIILNKENKKFNRILIDGVENNIDIRRELVIDYIQEKEVISGGLPGSVDTIKKWIDIDLEFLGDETCLEVQRLKYLLKVLEVDNNFFKRYIAN